MANGHIVYVSCSKGRRIEVAHLDGTTGAFDVVQSVELPGEGMPLAVAADGRHLHAALQGDGQDPSQPAVATFAIEPTTGRLSERGLVKSPARLSHITVTPGGRFLLAASVAGSVVASFAVRDDGLLEDAHSVVPVRAGAHHITLMPAGDRALVPNLGADVVQQFGFEAATGRIIESGLEVLEIGPGFAPRHIAHHPAGGWAYLINEKGGTVDQLVIGGSGAAYEATFPYIAPSQDEDAWGAQILVRPDGRFLYTSERNSSTVQAHAIDPDTGALVMTGVWPVETCPRNFALTEDGRFLVVAGEKSGHVSAHALDNGSGALGMPAGGRLATGDGPVWVITRVRTAG
jgi:6-phosphogluconolactonase